MIILDTNIVSETAKSEPNAKVIDWLKNLPRQSTFTTVITLMELWSGTLRLPEGKRKMTLEKQTRIVTDQIYAGRILPFDLGAAEICGRLLATNWTNGINTTIPDIQIAAIALSRGFTLATRNIADFQFEGLKLVNPWAE